MTQAAVAVGGIARLQESKKRMKKETAKAFAWKKGLTANGNLRF